MEKGKNVMATIKPLSNPASSGKTFGNADIEAALHRAAHRAMQTALQSGTPCWVMEDGKLVDAAARYRTGNDAGIEFADIRSPN